MIRLFRLPVRRFNTSRLLYNGNLFGEVTKPSSPNTEISNNNEALDPEDYKNLAPKDDEKLQQYYKDIAIQNQISEDKYLSPLKIELFKLNVQENGFFKNHQVVNKDGDHYKLSLQPKEIDLLEPTIYLKSFRIKSSMKKATIVNRFVRGLNVKNAINQLHFNPKKMATELEKLLKTGLQQATDLGLDNNELYIQSLWTGSDGGWRKRLDPKSRGRFGIINHRYVHLKAILKTDVTKKRIQWEKQEKLRLQSPPSGLNTEPLNFKVQPHYKW